MRKGCITYLLLGVFALSIGMIGCGNQEQQGNNNGNVNQGNQQNQQETQDEEVYFFEIDGVKIYVDGELEEIEAELGEPKSYFEQPSCAVDGLAKIFTYSGFEMETYELEGVDYIAYLVLKDDTVATPEGIDLSMTKADVIRVYGEDYEETDTSILYRVGTMALRFIFDGENIISIEYCSELYL